MPPTWNRSQLSKPWPTCSLLKVVLPSLMEGFGDARQVEIDFLVLPPRVDMHGGCVDLLHHAKAPALHF